MIGTVLPDFQNCCDVTHYSNPAYRQEVSLPPLSPLTYTAPGGVAMHRGRQENIFKRILKSLYKHGADGMSCLSCSFNHLELTLVNLNVPEEAVEQF